ncbi:hypothetical protein niasHS_001687 [Heterodera schachtii]|uniref:SAM-dependent MTase TRM10-type domain-containing protein n=1 Tax=Heterodera schachtii TaxID=97005 RepID=A0ABD2KC99_HETSC
MRLDSFCYRFIWRLKRRFYRYKDKCGPIPIVEREQPCRHFAPPATVLATVQQRNCPEQLANFERLCAQLQFIPRVATYLPTQLEERDWHRLLELHSAKERLCYLTFLVKRNKMRQKTEHKKAQMQLMRSGGGGTAMPKTEEEEDELEEEFEEEEEGRKIVEEEEEKEERDKEEEEEKGDEQRTATRKNKAFALPFISTANRIAASHRYIRSLQLAETPRIAFDCRFLTLHSKRGLNLTMLQLQMLLSANRDRQMPWPIHLCNFPSTSSSTDDDGTGGADAGAVAEVHALCRMRLNSLDSTRCVTGELHTESYTELFPELRSADKIVYLSPHSKESLTHIDPDACYVIGAIVDRAREPRIPPKASLLVSEEEQLPCRRFPIPPEFLRGGNPMLTLVQAMTILQHVFHSPGGDDWHGAFEQYIPKRKRLAPAEKNTVIRLRYDNIHTRNREMARIVEQRIPTTAAAANVDQQQTNNGGGRSDQKMAVGMRFLSRIFG